MPYDEHLDARIADALALVGADVATDAVARLEGVRAGLAVDAPRGEEQGGDRRRGEDENRL